MSESGKPGDDEKEARDRKAAADSLRRQIDNLKSGNRHPPQSLNEFVQDKMADDEKEPRE